jgi:hypothetical protein
MGKFSPRTLSLRRFASCAFAVWLSLAEVGLVAGLLGNVAGACGASVCIECVTASYQRAGGHTGGVLVPSESVQKAFLRGGRFD